MTLIRRINKKIIANFIFRKEKYNGRDRFKRTITNVLAK